MRCILINDMINADKTTQTYSYTDNGVNVNRFVKNNIRQNLQLKYGISRKAVCWTFWKFSRLYNKSQQIQTMALEVNEIYYGREKLLNRLKSESPQAEPESEDLKNILKYRLMLLKQ